MASLVKAHAATDFATLKVEPLGEQGQEEKEKLAKLVDFLHENLLTLSPDAEEEDDEESETIDAEAFSDFIEEGRKMLSISSSRVVWGETAEALEHEVWTSVAELLAAGDSDSGLLVAMPSYLGDSRGYLEKEIIDPLEAIGIRHFDAESYRVAQGSPFPAFRLIYAPSEVPHDHGDVAIA